MARGKRANHRTQGSVAVRILYVEPSECEQVVIERLWTALFSDPKDDDKGAAGPELDEAV
jgi:hypothetical protein